MQTIFENENERSSSRGANSVGVIIYTERIGGYLEEEHVGRSGERIIRI